MTWNLLSAWERSGRPWGSSDAVARTSRRAVRSPLWLMSFAEFRELSEAVTEDWHYQRYQHSPALAHD